jgi:hypothetical protein
VNRFSGCFSTVGKVLARPICPVRIDGTASEVHSWTVVAFGYQVASRASRPNAG